MAATSSASGPAPHVRHLVVPGQVIAVSGGEGDDPDGGFLRGHGTYVETFGGGGGADSDDDDGDGGENKEGNEASAPPPQRQRLVASVLGTVERVNKLVSIVPASSGRYSGQVGDLIIGRISAVGATRWRVNLTPSTSASGSQTCRDAHLPLSGVDLPGGVQRIRTAEDARSMRSLYREGDPLSAEVQSAQQSDGSLMLHTRSLRYGKLENGCMVCVPPGLIKRMRQHMCTLGDPINVDVWIGCNGGIWIQRSIPKSWDGAESAAASTDGGGGEGGGQKKGIATDEDAAAPQAETLRRLRARHASTPVLPDERENIARVRNSVECLRLVHRLVTPENVRDVYEASEEAGMSVADMLRPENVVKATECTRI